LGATDSSATTHMSLLIQAWEALINISYDNEAVWCIRKLHMMKQIVLALTEKKWGNKLINRPKTTSIASADEEHWSHCTLAAEATVAAVVVESGRRSCRAEILLKC